MNRFKLICLVGLALSVMTAKGQNYTTPFNHCLLDEKVYDQLVGESSGEQAYYHILDVAPYERDRLASDYSGLFMESKYVVNLLKSYGIDNATVEQLGKTKTWDGISASMWEVSPKTAKIISASMWEVSPKTAKIADYRDLAAILGQGSKNTDVTAPLVWRQFDDLRSRPEREDCRDGSDGFSGTRSPGWGWRLGRGQFLFTAAAGGSASDPQ